MSESFYKTLGVDEKSSKDEIKRAFRTLSMKHHPDKNPGDPDAVAKFQKISEAYETLGDDEKREQYDMMNKNPFFKMAGGVNGMEVNIDELFGSLFGNMGFFPGQGPPFGPGQQGPMAGFPGMPGGARFHVFHGPGGPMGFQQAIQKPSPIVKTITINIENVLTGAKIPLDIERWIIENGSKMFETETVYVDIPQGIDENEIIIIRDKGNIINDNFKGDIKIFVKITNNTEFKRSGLDLILEKEISLKESLCGFSFELKYINGNSYTLNNNSGNIIEPEYKKIIPGMGLKREGHVGNLIIHFHVKFPEKLTEEQITDLKKIL
jgi:DnaJ-class molecular chaperone